MTSHEILNIIDENKENISNGDYLKLTNLLLKKNNKENKSKFYFIEIRYAYSKYTHHYNLSTMNIGITKQIVKINQKQLERLNETWEHCESVPQEIKEMLENHAVIKYISSHDECDECESMSDNGASVVFNARTLGWTMVSNNS